MNSLTVRYSQEIEAIKARVKEMEEEAEKLKEMQGEVEKQLMGKPGWQEKERCVLRCRDFARVLCPFAPAAGSNFPSMEEKMDADSRSVYVGNVSFCLV